MSTDDLICRNCHLPVEIRNVEYARAADDESLPRRTTDLSCGCTIVESWDSHMRHHLEWRPRPKSWLRQHRRLVLPNDLLVALVLLAVIPFAPSWAEGVLNVIFYLLVLHSSVTITIGIVKDMKDRRRVEQ